MPDMDLATGAPPRKRRWIAFLLVLLAVLAGGAVFSTLIYENSPAGVASLVGELIGAGILVALLSIPWRKKAYTPAVALAIAALSVGISNGQRLAEALETKRARAALTTVSDRTRPEQALQQDPSNPLLKLTVEVYRIGQETLRLTEKLSDDIEPAALAADFDMPKADRAALESYHAALRTAERNAEAAIPQYASLQRAERDRLEYYAQSLNLSRGTLRELLAVADRRHAKAREITGRMLQARQRVYRTTADVAAILVAEYGNYTTNANGEIIFANSAVIDRYNAAAKEVDDALAQLERVDAERQDDVRRQQETWDRFMSGQPAVAR